MDDLSILIKPDDELAFRLGFHYSQVYLFDGINGLVVIFFKPCASAVITRRAVNSVRKTFFISISVIYAH